ncbi:hypothetical protein J7L60_02480 [Candidatus Bathyarchaeota archaeon]|nr:hypothetical protein [Candidatus Bathyarchaeota archaeon]
MSGETCEKDHAQSKLLRSLRLHYCRRYRNLVRFNEETCGRCPFSGRRRGSSERCF